MDEVELILTYVPEAEYLSFEDALKLAGERDEIAAQTLIDSVQTV